MFKEVILRFHPFPAINLSSVYDRCEGKGHGGGGPPRGPPQGPKGDPKYDPRW